MGNKLKTDIIINLFEANSNEENARAMKKYMKGKFEYLGIKTPLRKELSKQYFKDHGQPDIDSLIEDITTLWGLDYREYQYLAINIATRFKDNVPKHFIDFYEDIALKKSWWDTIDLIAASLMGAYFLKYPEAIKKYTGRWIKSDIFWLQRCALLFQLKYKDKTDFDLLCDYILQCSGDNEFFIRKAIGWALREYSKTDAIKVIEFVNDNQLKPLSKREALKWIEKHK